MRIFSELLLMISKMITSLFDFAVIALKSFIHSAGTDGTPVCARPQRGPGVCTVEAQR